MIGVVSNHLLVKMNRSDYVQKNSNSLALKSSFNQFQMKRDDEVGLCENEPSPQIRMDKG